MKKITKEQLALELNNILLNNIVLIKQNIFNYLHEIARKSDLVVFFEYRKELYCFGKIINRGVFNVNENCILFYNKKEGQIEIMDIDKTHEILEVIDFKYIEIEYHIDQNDVFSLNIPLPHVTFNILNEDDMQIYSYGYIVEYEEIAKKILN